MPAPHDRSAPRITRSAVAALLGATLAWGGCSSDKPPDALRIPAVSSLRAASEILVEEVENDDGAPKWIDRDRVTEGFVYGIGIQSGGRRPSEDLFLAMHAARRTIVVWLESRGAGATPGLMPSVRIDPDRIDFERLARDTESNRWYALARLDVGREATSIEAAVAELEQSMSAARAKSADSANDELDRVGAALSILYGLDRRGQYDALHLALTGGPVPLGEGVDLASLRKHASEVLGRHGVRVVVDGPYVAGLHEAVSIAMGEVQLRSDEFGRGLVVVRLNESDGFGPGNPYLEIDGTVELALDGNASSVGSTFHVVSTGSNVDEARFRAARTVNLEVARIVRETLLAIGGVGGG